MIYNAGTPRKVLGCILLLTILMIPTTSINDFSRWTLYFQIISSLVIFCLLFIKYKFELNEGYMTYQILFFSLPLYKTRVYPNQITQIMFKRFGWNTKGAIIQVKKGFNIRIIYFIPNDVFMALINFANKNDISYSKTKDYCILEK